jgi:hypothetical protein
LLRFFFERVFVPTQNTPNHHQSNRLDRDTIRAIEDEASGDDSRAATQPNVKKKTTEEGRKKKGTHHTPTHEYVVPKSIPMAGPSDFADMILLSSFKVFFLSSFVCKISADLVFCEAFFFSSKMAGKKRTHLKP